MLLRPSVMVLLVAALSSGCAAPAAGPAPSSPPALTARGTGTVTSTPDRLTVVLGVQNRGRAAQEALDANNRLATATIEALRAAGVAETDLRTSQLSVFPTQDPTTGRITGYEVNNLVTATLRDIGRAGSVIDAAGAAAGDAIRVQQLEFSVADDSAPRAQARADAVRKAQEQARQLADAAGVALGAVRSITENAAEPPVPYERDSRAAAQAAVPILPGTQELRVGVEIVYEIR
jgi:uncharacterized protein YggE